MRMRNLYKKSVMLLILLFAVGWQAMATESCGIVFNLHDSYGDGWNGNKLVVSDGNALNEELTFDNGSSASFTLIIAEGSHVTLSWIGGDYPEECTYTVRFENGYPIYEGESLIDSTYEFDLNCDDANTPVTIAVSISPDDAGTASGGGEFVCGESCTVTATPNEGYSFWCWVVDDRAVSTQANYTFTVTGPGDLLAVFRPVSNANYIVFVDPNVEAVCLQQGWDTDEDRYLSYAEAAAVTDLGSVFRNNTEITSFNELQYFTGLTSIGEGAFEGCVNLTTITLPNSVTSIGINPFAGCTSLETITVEEGNTVYDSRDNSNAIIETATNTLISGCQNTIIPNTVTSIGFGAFAEIESLTSIIIPNSVTSIGDYAFGWSGLTSIIIPNSVTSIGDYAFGWSGLTTITLPNSVTSIGNFAFAESGLATIIIPNSVTIIGESAFEGCGNLTSITIPNSVASIGDYAFGWSGLTSITIPNSVASLGNYAFTGCGNLEAVVLSETLTFIGEGTFQECENLTSITIPKSVTSIGEFAFAGCMGLTSLIIPSSVQSIGNSAFAGCTGLTSMIIFNTDVEMGDNVYDGVEFPEDAVISASASPADGGGLFGLSQGGGGSAFVGTLNDFSIEFAPQGSGEIPSNYSVLLMAKPNEGWQFVGWQINGELVSDEALLMFRAFGEFAFEALFESCGVESEPELLNGRFSVSDCTTVGFARSNTIMSMSDLSMVEAVLFGVEIPGLHYEIGENQWDRMTYDASALNGNSEAYEELLLTGADILPSFMLKNNVDCWHIPTWCEWDYMLNQRETASGIRFAYGIVNDVSGLIILPDDWEASTYNALSNVNEIGNYDNNVIDAETWTTVLEPAGAVFLPANGYIVQGALIQESSDGQAVGAYPGLLFSPSGEFMMGQMEGFPMTGPMTLMLDMMTMAGMMNSSSSGSFGGTSVRLAKAMDNSTATIVLATNDAERGTVTGGGEFACQQECTVTATANDGYVFMYWLEDGVAISLDPVYSFKLLGDRNLIAVFAPVDEVCQMIIETTAPSNTSFQLEWFGMGLSLSFDDGTPPYNIPFGTSPESLDFLEILQLMQSMQSGNTNTNYTFTVNILRGSNVSLDVWMPEDMINLMMGSGGSISDLGLTFTVSYVDGATIVENSSELPYNFLCNCADITLLVDPEEGGYIETDDVLNIGETVTLTAIANYGYTFVNWTFNGVEVSTDPTYSFEVMEPGALVAHFELQVINSLSDDFNDGVIAPELWLSTGNNVYEEDGLLKMDQNVTDQNVSLLSRPMSVRADNKIVMERRFIIHRGSNYAYPGFAIEFDGETGIHGRPLNAAGWDGTTANTSGVNYIGVVYGHTAYEDKYGIYVEEGIGDEIQGTRLCDAIFDTWLAEIVVIDLSAGTFTYYLNDNYVATVEMPELAMLAVDYYTTIFSPWGWYTGHQQYMDHININITEERVITVTADPSEGGTVTGGGNFNFGENCTVSATANEGYAFSNWMENGETVSTNALYTFQVTSNRNLVTHFVRIGNIVFADTQVKALCVANWDTDQDGEISYAEADAVTDLGDVFRGNEYITSFDELQYFTGLTSLYYHVGFASGTFNGCHNLTSVVIPNSVTIIGDGAFSGCTSLLSVEIPNSVVSIFKGAFSHCASLTSIALPNSVIFIGENAFRGCDNLNSIVLSETLMSIGAYAFATSGPDVSSGLTSIIIPNMVTDIGDFAFAGLGLTSITIPGSVTSIGANPFAGCTALETITVETGNQVYDSRDNCNGIIETASNTLLTGCMNTVIPNSVTSIGATAFVGCTSLSSIEIPNSVVSIGASAFNNCTGLTSLVVLATEPPVLANGVFENVDKSIPVYVPVGTVNAYASAEGWNEFTYFMEGIPLAFSMSTEPEGSGTFYTELYQEIGSSYSGVWTETDISVVARANKGWRFAYWTANDEVLSANNVYTFHLSENTDLVAHFDQCELETEPDPELLSGRFSVSGCTTVGFAKGNVIAQIQFDTIYWSDPNSSVITKKYNPTSASWQFAETQYYRQEYDSLTILQNGYGDYLTTGMDLVSGLHQALGLVDIGCWHELSGAEWDYLLNQRDVEVRYAFAKVNGVSGLLVLPDNWQSSTYALNAPNATADYATNSITLFDWENIVEPAGALFLPANGTIENNGSVSNPSYMYVLNGTDGEQYCPVGFYGDLMFAPLFQEPMGGGVMTGIIGMDFMMAQLDMFASMRLAQIVQMETSTVNAIASQTERGLVSGGGQFACNDECTLNATATDGYVFQYWKEDGSVVSVENPYVFTVKGDRNLSAVFADADEVCNVQFDLDCGSNSFGVFGMGGEGLQLSFDDGTPDIQLTIPAPEFDWYAILLESLAGETIDPTSFGFPTSRSYSIPINKGTNVEMSLVALQPSILSQLGSIPVSNKFSASYVFGETIVENAGSGATPSFQCDCEGYAVELNLSVDPEEGGTITTEGLPYYEETVTLTAEANEGYHFVNWTFNGAEVSTDAVYSFVVTEGGDLVAHFDINYYEVTAVANPEEGGTVSSITELIFNLNDSYGDGWTSNQLLVYLEGYPEPMSLTVNSGSFTSIPVWVIPGRTITLRWQNGSFTEECSFEVYYADGTLIYSCSSPSTSLPYSFVCNESNGTYQHGSTCTLVAEPNEDYTFVNWTENGEEVSTDSWYEFEVTSDRNLVANFSPPITITATANPAEGGTITGTGIFDYGTYCTLTATPNEGFTFGAWTEDGVTVSTDAAYGFTVTQERHLVAEFLSLHTISATCNPSEGGTVSGAGNYGHGTECTLTAEANFGYNFDNWTLDGTVVSTEPTYTFTVTEPAEYVANFVLKNYDILATANPNEGGTVSGTGNYNHFETCTLVATANWGYTFINWTLDGNVVSTEPSYTFTVTSAGDYTANFQLNNYAINASANPSEGGSVSGAGNYDHGTECTLTATSNVGYTFVNWTLDGVEVGTDPTYTFTVYGDATYVANFSLNLYEITAIANPVEGGSITGADNYYHGSGCTLTATPNEGYTFMYWSEGGNMVSYEANYGFVATGDRALVAHFAANEQNLSLNPGWTWLSSYIEMEGIDGLGMLENGLNPNGVMIKSQRDGFVSYANEMWMGTLENITNEKMYLVNTNEASNVNFTGPVAQLNAHPITLNPNWTWLGYPVPFAVDINEALANLNASEGDVVKSQSSFATYSVNDGWSGSLNQLTPGMGLMYQSHNSQPVTFNYGVGMSRALKANHTAENNHWVPDIHAYPNNMSIMAVVELNGEELQDERYELAVFNGSECRGSARLAYVPSLRRHVAFLTVAGEDDVELYLALYDTRKGKAYYNTTDCPNFEANAVLGSLSMPFVARFGSATELDELDVPNIELYPNPVVAGHLFQMEMPAECQGARVSIVNALGAVISTTDVYDEPAIMRAPAVPGVYTVRIVTDKQGTFTRKLIVNK